MKMNKIAISLLAAFTLAQAQDLPYKVFVQTFDSPNATGVESTYNQVKNALSGYNNISVVKRPSGKYYVVAVETVMDEGKFNKMFSKIKSLPGHGDAFFLPAPELLNDARFKDGAAVASAETEVPVVEEEQAPSDVKNVDTDAALAPRSDNPGEAISLEQAIGAVLEKNPSVKQRIFNYMEVGKDLDISERGYYPTLDLTASIGMGRDKASEGAKDGAENKWTNSVSKNAELRLVQNLYDGGIITNNVAQEKSRMVNASYLVLERADRTSLATVDSYLNVIKEKTLLDLSAENIKRLEDIYAQIKERADTGYGRMSEKQQAASRLTLAQSNFIAQQNAYDDAISTFQKLTGYVVDAEQLTYPEFSYALPDSVKSVEDKALMCNPAVRAEKANIELAKEVYKGSNAAYLPKIDLEGYASYQNTRNYAYDDQRIDSYGALLRLNYNLFNKGIDMVTKEKRQVTIQKEQEVFEEVKRDLRESLKFSWQSYVLNQKKMSYLADHAKFSKETLDAYKEEFNIGRRELINVLDAENEYFNSRKEITTAERDLLYAKYRLMDNMGLITDSFKPGFGQKYIKDACSIESNL